MLWHRMSCATSFNKSKLPPVDVTIRDCIAKPGACLPDDGHTTSTAQLRWRQPHALKLPRSLGERLSCRLSQNDWADVSSGSAGYRRVAVLIRVQRADTWAGLPTGSEQ